MLEKIKTTDMDLAVNKIQSFIYNYACLVRVILLTAELTKVAKITTWRITLSSLLTTGPWHIAYAFKV
jgi:hypothetical protein